MNERQQSHIDYYLQRLEYWKGRKPASSTARLLAARDADEAHPLQRAARQLTNIRLVRAKTARTRRRERAKTLKAVKGA